jgi:hypothetical protein
MKITVLQATGVDARNLNPKAARILSEAKAATWEVHRLWEILLPTTTRVPSYYENPVTQKKSSHACLIIEILSWIQNSSFIDLRAIDVWGRRIARCGEIRKQRRRRCTVWSVPFLQEVIKYAIKQYLYKIGKLHTWYLPVLSRWCTASTPRDVTTFHQFGGPGFGGTDWTRNWR